MNTGEEMKTQEKLFVLMEETMCLKDRLLFK